jgi:DNA polymerase-3 subunit beta
MSTEAKVITQEEAERREALAASFRPLPGPAKPTDTASFSLAQSDLLQALATLMKTLPPTRYGLDILKHVQIKVETDRIVLRGTNLSTCIEVVLPAQVTRTGTYTIHARTLHDSVKTFPKTGRVKMVVQDGRVNVTCGKRTFSLKDATDGNEFPRLPEVQSSQPCILTVNVLRQAIKEVQFAAGDDDGRVVHLAICMDVREDEMHLVALNGMRMSIRTLALPRVSGRNCMVLVEASSWRLLCDVMPKDGEVTLVWDKERACFTCGNLRLVARLIEGHYPKYQAALPATHKTTFTLQRSELLSLLAAFRPFTRDDSNILKLSYAAEGVTFAARSDEMGEVSEALAMAVTGEDGYALFDAEYIADVLKNVAEESFTFSVSGYGHPCLMTPVGRDDYQALVMPMSCDR